MKKIVYLSGGIGGAKLAKGFYHSNDIDLTIIIITNRISVNSEHWTCKSYLLKSYFLLILYSKN